MQPPCAAAARIRVTPQFVVAFDLNGPQLFNPIDGGSETCSSRPRDMHSMTTSSCQRMIEIRDRLNGPPVLTLGGANIEHGYRIQGKYSPDKKYSSDPLPRLAGGSSLNHASRLLALGIDVHPVLPLAKADGMTRLITAALDRAATSGGSKFRRKELEIRGDGLTTPFTTIIRQADSRASFNEFSPELMTRFSDHVDRHLEALQGSRRPPRVTMLGHVHADRAAPGKHDIGFSGEITDRILKARALTNSRTFVNFGSAQYSLGARRWSETLRDHVDVFQLDISEARQFCRDADICDLSLESLLGWFRERCTVVVSLERFGAIGQLAGSSHAVAAWPYLIDSVSDSTGAGDAMGAGIVASMLAQPFENEKDDDLLRQKNFSEALAFGRVCGAYACTTLGGASDCPTLEDLEKFERHMHFHRPDHGPNQAVTSHELLLIDRAFEH
jgi:hypothetical protein